MDIVIIFCDIEPPDEEPTISQDALFADPDESN
ncbi:MAG: hypothetical protein QOD00_1340 [Blastocatellia bacterium]|jgi:hypothetical protein|nr:hypothetical protein [Blastocatellia bacterium]